MHHKSTPFAFTKGVLSQKKGGAANAATRPFLIWYTAINSGERYEKRQATKCDNKGIALRLPWMGLLYFLINIEFVHLTRVAFFYKRTNGHAQQDLVATVVEHHKIVVGGVDRKAFNLTCTAEVAHFTE